MESELADAVQCYIDRKHGDEVPDGEMMDGRWYATEDEWQACCGGLAAPSVAWPMSRFDHCCTAKHVAAMYGVRAVDVRRVAKLVEAADAHHYLVEAPEPIVRLWLASRSNTSIYLLRRLAEDKDAAVAKKAKERIRDRAIEALRQ